jgi:amino acid adenylation domain-containing protein
MADDIITKHAVDYDPFAEGEIQLTAPLTESQKELWASVQMGDEANCAYNESMSFLIIGKFSHEIMQLAINDLIQMHDAFRATFSPDGALMMITDNLRIDISYIDFLSLSETDKEKKLKELLIQDVSTPFSLEHGPLIRVGVIQLEEQKYRVILTAHHIICDGWSMAVAIRDLAFFYNIRKNGKVPAIEPRYLFSDYAVEDNQHLESAEGREAEKFWLSHFSGDIPIMDMPTDHPRPPIRTFNANRVDYQLPSTLVKDLKKVGAQSGATFITILLAGFKAYLYRVTGQPDIIVGTPTAGQSATGKDTLVGHCVNLLPLRSQIAVHQSFLGYLKDIRGLMLDAFEYQRYTFVSLIKKIQIPRDPSRIPLVPIIFNMDQQSNEDGFAVEGLEADIFSNHRTYENFEIFLNVSSAGERVVLECTYNSNLFDKESIRMRLAEYETILSSIVAAPNSLIDDLPILPDEERQRLLVDWNQTALDYPKHLCLHQLLERQAADTPDRLAVEFSGSQLTYRTLDETANQLANYIIDKGVVPGGMIGICLERSLDMIIALLAILKTGNAYVPLDPEYPVTRLKYMVENAELSTLITQKKLQDYLGLKTERTINIDITRDKISAFSSASPPVFSDQQHVSTPEDIAYAIYTSGSTGKPKGVKVPHRAVVNFLASMAKCPGINQDDILLAVTTLSFDIAGLELFLPLATGAKVVIAKKEETNDVNLLSNLISTSRATIMQATPATWHMLVNGGWPGNKFLKILCGGEALPNELKISLFRKCSELWNMYGPTETTIWSACFQVTDRNQDVLVGKPIGNTKIYVLDKKMQPVPIGIPGELFIGGDGVTKGYHKRDELTDRHFLTNPFSSNKNDVIYRTGDLVRYKHDGNLEYLNRIDNQVKMRGFRIELGEIEAGLGTFQKVARGVASIIDYGHGDKRLVAYYMAKKTLSVNTNELKSHLRKTLPEYMLPQHYVELERFPLTPAGKIDRKALPFPGAVNRDDENAFISAETDCEKDMLAIWQNVLSEEHISITDNFFEIGGHSLLATQAVGRIRQQFKVSITLRDFFTNPTIRGLSEFIDSITVSPDVFDIQIIPKRITENSPISFQQQRLWLLNKLNPGATVFNLAAGWRIIGPLNADLFEQCINRVFERHESMRTAIKDFDDGPRQIIVPVVQFYINRVDLSKEQKNEREGKLYDFIRTDSKSIFDLSKAPLFKATLYKFSDIEHVFSYMPHHVIWDGWSFDIFRHELKELYESALTGQPTKLPDLPIQYADYSEWQRNRVNTPEYKSHIDYWKKQLAGDLPVLQLPTDYPRPAILTYDNGGSESISIPSQITDALTEVAHGSDATLYMLLLAAFNILLHRYTHDNDIIIGTPISGRDQVEIGNLIGFFVNTLVIRTKIDEEKSFHDFLRQIRETCIDAFNHQEAPFEQLVEILNPERDLSRSPIFQVLFIYQDARNRKDNIADLSLSYIDSPTPGTQTDIDFWVRLTDSGIVGGIRYNRDLFKSEMIKQMQRNYHMILEGILKAATVKIKDINLLPKDDYQKTVYQWNNMDCVFQHPSTIHQLFENQTVNTPDAVAVVCNGNSLSYRDLNSRANQWAYKLRETGVTNNNLVGICVNRSIEMLVCLLGILKAGSAYLPLDPDYPKERLLFMIEDAKVEVILAERAVPQKISSLAKKIIYIDDIELGGLPISNPEFPVSADSLAYIIYTSGSTGIPKGVQVSHATVRNLLLSVQKQLNLKLQDKLLAVITLSFDMSVFELFLPISIGASIVIADQSSIRDGEKLASLLHSSKATVMQATPSTWRMLLSTGWEGSDELVIISGGEPMSSELLKQLYTRCRELWDMYGPTEITVYATANKITSPDAAPCIGKPLANVKAYILDAQLHPVPVGVAGELYIGGAGVTKGYLNRPELTAEKFVINPFIKSVPGKQQPVMYRTGDLVRYQSDGSIVYLERIDNQVKIRGFRIELGEIENALVSHNKISQAVVVCREDRPGDKRIYAYILPHTLGHFDPIALKRHVRTRLPEYMVPQYFIEIEAVPLTPVGKVDKQALPLPDKTSFYGSNEYALPTTTTEKKLAQIWRQVISLSQIGIDDNFFDIGGHSLLAVEIFAGIKKMFHLELPLAILFQSPTIHDLANYIDAELYLAGSDSKDVNFETESEEFEF